MNISRVFVAAAIAATFNLSSVSAQSLSQGLVPAEFPPSSYQGRQYVDSEGCVFIRAGVDGNVTWVPRVTRSRKAICGFQPTFARAAPAVKATQPKVASVVATAPKAKAKRQAVNKVEVIEVSAAPTADVGQAACRGGNAVSQKYVGRVGENVRCGPQQGSAAFVRRNNTKGVTSTKRRQVLQKEQRLVPRHVFESQMASRPAVKIPKGYKPAWDDDRLNPKRAHQTRAGKAQMDLVWTQTIPRKLIQRKVEFK